MQSTAIQSLLTCALGVAVMAGCAAPSSTTTTTSSMETSNIRSGKVASVEPAETASDPTTMSSSGSGAAGTAASGGPALVTVDFADGTQGRYYSSPVFPVGTPIEVVSVGDRTVFRPPMTPKQ